MKDEDMSALNIQWPAATGSQRKMAAAQEFAESNLKPDVIEFRKKYLAAKTADQLDALLVEAEKNWGSFSLDLKYFTANLLVARPLRGLIWRMRPLFETGGLFSGNRATHGAAVYFLRQMATGIDTFFPTDQWEAGFAYLTEPSTKMTKAQQFKTVREFQKFLATEFVAALQTAAGRSDSVIAAAGKEPLVWDRQMVYGTATFEDGAKRYVGFGPAEIYFSTAVLYRGIHDALVFTAYNQDDLINLAGRLGKRFGIDAAIQGADIGTTAQQRVAIINESVTNSGFLKLQDYKGSNYGSKAMKDALAYLVASVKYDQKGYEYLKDPSRNTDSYVLNGLHVQPRSAPHLKRAVDNMVAVVSGETEVRDPVSGDKVRVNLPAFYNNPYPNLAVLMANDFDKKAPETTITNEKGEKLSYRNYLHGSANSWDNGRWSKIVPSAQSQKADYMKTAKRVIFYSIGTPLVAGPVTLFVR
jgi:hypothetical protein